MKDFKTIQLSSPEKFREVADQEVRGLLEKKNPIATWEELMEVVERFGVQDLVKSIIEDFHQPAPVRDPEARGFRIRTRPTKVGFAMRVRERLRSALGMGHS